MRFRGLHSSEAESSSAGAAAAGAGARARRARLAVRSVPTADGAPSRAPGVSVSASARSARDLRGGGGASSSSSSLLPPPPRSCRTRDRRDERPAESFSTSARATSSQWPVLSQRTSTSSSPARGARSTVATCPVRPTRTVSPSSSCGAGAAGAGAGAAAGAAGFRARGFAAGFAAGFELGFDGSTASGVTRRAAAASALAARPRQSGQNQVPRGTLSSPAQRRWHSCVGSPSQTSTPASAAPAASTVGRPQTTQASSISRTAAGGGASLRRLRAGGAAARPAARARYGAPASATPGGTGPARPRWNCGMISSARPADAMSSW